MSLLSQVPSRASHCCVHTTSGILEQGTRDTTRRLVLLLPSKTGLAPFDQSNQETLSSQKTLSSGNQLSNTSIAIAIHPPHYPSPIHQSTHQIILSFHQSAGTRCVHLQARQVSPGFARFRQVSLHVDPSQVDPASQSSGRKTPVVNVSSISCHAPLSN
jgi:hypothetical protein